MVKFRRSLKSVDKGVPSPQDAARQHYPVPMPSKQAPLKVIKAIYDYEAPPGQTFQLSFAAGDFLHVVGREFDTEWYEATNPLKNSRGLVPVAFFEQVGKTVRDSRGSESTGGSGNHDSGYAEQRANSNAAAAAATSAANSTTSSTISGPMRTSTRMPRGSAPVYGVVAYDFKAERPDELDAKEGEAIIVIAQSNPEWFVAKPITRLGGPGLIPVSFIEIKDMATGNTISDKAAAVALAGIPRVEEWKKMAAEYKNTSIPLGSIGNAGPTSPIDALSYGMDRMSVNGQGGYGHPRSHSISYNHPHGYQLAPLHAAVPRYLYADDKFHFVVEVRLADGTHWDLTRIYEDFYELQINLIKAFPDEAGNTGQPRTLPLMPGPVQFVTDRITEGRRENLDEYLYKLLMLGPHIVNSSFVRGFFAPRGNDYECGAGQNLEDHAQSAYAHGGQHHQQMQYQQHLQQQQQQQQQQQDYRRYSNTSGSGRGSTASQQQQHPQQHSRGQSSLGSSSTHAEGLPGTSYAPSHPTTRNLTQQTSTASSSSTTVATPAMQGGPSGTAAIGSGGSAMKVKVWFDRDTCVVLRLPPRGGFSYQELRRKIMERRRLEYNSQLGTSSSSTSDTHSSTTTTGGQDGSIEGGGGHDAEGGGEGGDEGLWIEYRDESSGEYLPLGSSEELEMALARCEKLTLVVRQAG